MRYTKTFAKEILALWKHKSAVFNGRISMGELESRLKTAGLSQADAVAITMAIVIAGGKFME